MTIEIRLTQGKVAIIDDEDLPLVSQHKWYAHACRRTFYATTNIVVPGKRTILRMHRLILAAKPGQEVDHIDGDGLNNRRANIRLCLQSQNAMNHRKKLNSKSMYKGVTMYPRKSPWQANIAVNGTRIYLGSFTSETAAALAYDEAARLHFGEFARTNF